MCYLFTNIILVCVLCVCVMFCAFVWCLRSQSFYLLEIMRYLVLHKSYTKVIKLFLCLCFLPFHLSCPCQCFCPVQLLQYVTPPFNLIKDVKVIFCLCVCSTIPHLCTQVPHKLTNMLLMITWCLVQKLYPWLPQLPGEPGGGWKAARHIHLDLSHLPGWLLTRHLHLPHLPGWLLSPDMATPPDQPADNSWAPIRKHLDRTSETFKEKRSPCCLLVFLRPYNQLYCNGSEGLVMANQNTKWLLLSENKTN